VIEIIIPGQPYPLKRPRYSKRSQRVFDPEDNRAAKATVAAIAREAWGDRPVIVGAIKVQISFNYAWPKSTTKKRKDKPNGFYKITAGDIDNCVKWVFDGINNAGTVWKDDAQVAELWAIKRHTDIEPMTRVTIEALWEQE